MSENMLANLANINEGLATMKQVNIFEAKTDLSKLIRLLETKEEEKIVIARNGLPIAELVPYKKPDCSKRIGAAPGIADQIDWDQFFAMDNYVAEIFEESVNENII